MGEMGPIDLFQSVKLACAFKNPLKTKAKSCRDYAFSNGRPRETNGRMRDIQVVRDTPHQAPDPFFPKWPFFSFSSYLPRFL